MVTFTISKICSFCLCTIHCHFDNLCFLAICLDQDHDIFVTDRKKLTKTRSKFPSTWSLPNYCMSESTFSLGNSISNSMLSTCSSHWSYFYKIPLRQEKSQKWYPYRTISHFGHNCPDFVNQPHYHVKQWENSYVAMTKSLSYEDMFSTPKYLSLSEESVEKILKRKAEWKIEQWKRHSTEANVNNLKDGKKRKLSPPEDRLISTDFIVENDPVVRNLLDMFNESAEDDRPKKSMIDQLSPITEETSHNISDESNIIANTIINGIIDNAVQAVYKEEAMENLVKKIDKLSYNTTMSTDDGENSYCEKRINGSNLMTRAEREKRQIEFRKMLMQFRNSDSDVDHSSQNDSYTGGERYMLSPSPENTSMDFITINSSSSTDSADFATKDGTLSTNGFFTAHSKIFSPSSSARDSPSRIPVWKRSPVVKFASTIITDSEGQESVDEMRSTPNMWVTQRKVHPFSSCGRTPKKINENYTRGTAESTPKVPSFIPTTPNSVRSNPGAIFSPCPFSSDTSDGTQFKRRCTRSSSQGSTKITSFQLDKEDTPKLWITFRKKDGKKAKGDKAKSVKENLTTGKVKTTKMQYGSKNVPAKTDSRALKQLQRETDKLEKTITRQCEKIKQIGMHNSK